MRLLSFTLRSTLALTLAPLALAQGGPFDLAKIHRAPIDELAGGAPKYVSVAQVSADLKPDAVLFGNGACIFAFGPGAYDSHSYPEPLASVSNWVRVPGDATGDTERFLGTSANGLHLMSRSGGALVVDALPVTGWSSAGKIQVVDFDLDGHLDLVGLASSGGGTFLVVDDVLSGGSLSADPKVMPPPGGLGEEDVRAFVIMDWDGEEDLDVIAWSDNEGDSRVVKWNFDDTEFSLVYDRSFVPPAGHLAALDYPGSEPDRVAILFKAPTGSTWMLATAWNGGSDERVLLVSAELVGATAACLGGASDTYPDILTTNRQGVARVYTNSGSTQAFGATPTSTYDLLESSTSFDQTGSPALADLDSDGDLDLLCTVEATAGEYELVVVPGVYENRYQESPQIDAVNTFYLDDAESTPQVLIELEIDRGSAHDLPNVDGLAGVVWAVDDEVDNPADPTPVASGIVTVGSNWSSAQMDLELPVSLGAGGLYALEVREVDRDGSGDVVAAGPSVAWILHSEAYEQDVVELFPPLNQAGSVGLVPLQTGTGNVIINVLPTLYVPPFTDELYVDDPSTALWPY